MAAAFLVLSACSPGDLETSGHGAHAAPTGAPVPRVAWLEPPAPLDELAAAAAARLLAAPEDAPLTAWNGLERLGIRLERADWVQAARARFAARLADPRPLTSQEAAAFRERWAELRPEPALAARLRREGRSPEPPPPPDPWELLEGLRQLLREPPGPRFLALWGRTHAWCGHLWLDGKAAAIGFDGLRPEPGGPGLWRVQDLLERERNFTARRRHDHASIRWVAAGGATVIPARFPGEGGDEGAAAAAGAHGAH